MDILSSIEQFAIFMRLLAPPEPVTTTFTTIQANTVTAVSIAGGRTLFGTVGCALCHTPTLTTAPVTGIAALANRQANLFSDLMLHNMGDGLADGVNQGLASGDEFRTSPL